MRGLGLERPPRWGIALLIALVVGNIALFSFLSLRPDPEDPYAGRTQPAADQAALPAAAPSTTAPASAATTAPAETPLLAVYGDGYAAGNTLGGQGAKGWPALVAQQVGAELALSAVPQAGYVSVGTTGQDYGSLVQTSPVPEADVTVVFGSRNDADESPETVAEKAGLVIDHIRAEAPETTLVVIGPVWSDANPPEGVLAVNDAVRSAAADADVTFVDALDAGWFGDGQGIASDGVSPTDAGHARLAGLITPAVAEALS
jgi:lysophospholipase L1-like esterase